MVVPVNLTPHSSWIHHILSQERKTPNTLWLQPPKHHHLLIFFVVFGRHSYSSFTDK